MRALRNELDRLRRALARRAGARRAVVWHVVLLAGMCVLALVDRAIVPLPGLSALEGHWPAVVIVALLLLASGLLLERLAVRWSTPSTAQLARRLDDAHGWDDDTSTAVALPADGDAGLVGGFLAAQTAGRLKEVAGAVVGRPFQARYVRVALAFLFAFVLLAPGTQPMFSGEGPGGDEHVGIGPTGGGIGARAFDADWFLMTFVEDPLPVEPLPDDEAPDTSSDVSAGVASDAAPDAGGGR